MKRYIICGASLWKMSLPTLDNISASARHMPDAQGVKEDRGLVLDLCQCMGCGLVQFDCGPMGCYWDVVRTGDFSKTVVELYRYQYKHLIDSYRLEGKKFIEMGYGQGELSEILSEFPVEVHGIEHDSHLIELARAQRLDVTEGPTGTEDIRSVGGLYDVPLSSSFLEYQPDPSIILQTIYCNLEDDAMGLITVPSFEYIMDHNSYYELIRDHLAYYTFETLTPLLKHNGSQVEECEVISRNIFSVIVRKRPQMDMENLSECYVNLKQGMEACMKYLNVWSKKVAIWGTSHQGFTLAATIELGEEARYIINPAPFKQGKLASASHLPIVGPDHFHEHSVDAIIATAPDYTDEIAASIRQKFGTVMEIRTMRPDRLEMVQEG